MSARIRSVDLENPFHPSLDGMCEILLVRHGEQEYTESISMGDALDAPLSDLGRRQAAAVGERLSGVEIHAVYSSTLRRARDTGAAIGAHHDLEPRERHDLREIDLWRDFPQDQALLDVYSEQELVGIFRAAHRTRRWDAYPHTEPGPEFQARVLSTIDEIVAAHHGERVVVACHGGVINTVLANVLRSTIDNLVKVHHTSISVVRGADDRRVAISINDYAHVLPIQDAVNPLNLH
ncbi:MAG: histidine phosphatase family protein [Actinomycetota bacterium]